MKTVALLPCSFICCPKSWAFAASCHGRNTTFVPAGILLTTDEKSVDFWLTDSRKTATPAPLSFCSTLSAMPVEYDVWSSTMKTFLAFSSPAMWSASVGPWTVSGGTTRKNVLYLPLVVRAPFVAEADTAARFARSRSGPMASTSWLPAGPAIPTIAEFEMNCWATVEACPGSSCVSPWTTLSFVPFFSLNCWIASSAKRAEHLHRRVSGVLQAVPKAGRQVDAGSGADRGVASLEVQHPGAAQDVDDLVVVVVVLRRAPGRDVADELRRAATAGGGVREEAELPVGGGGAGLLLGAAHGG